MGDIQQDPSMEEILASIKRVIAEDSRAPAGARVRRSPPPEPAASEDDVLELDDPVSETGGLLSTDAAAASRERLAALSALRQRDMPADTGALEAVVREMLKPMLKEWLDEHLPAIVEQLVTREIARITGRSL
jgi:cell pole-organizing protein PopZ